MTDATPKLPDQCEVHRIAKVRMECIRCDGEGEIEPMDDDDFHPETCYRCRGSGLNPWTSCEVCEQDAKEREFEEASE